MEEPHVRRRGCLNPRSVVAGGARRSCGDARRSCDDARRSRGDANLINYLPWSGVAQLRCSLAAAAACRRRLNSNLVHGLVRFVFSAAVAAYLIGVGSAAVAAEYKTNR